MMHLIIRGGVVVNRVNGDKPEILETTDTWIAAEGYLADAQIGWIEQEDGTYAEPPPPPEPEPEPEPTT